eukprot:4688024-Amphidinium_carterae.1
MHGEAAVKPQHQQQREEERRADMSFPVAPKRSKKSVRTLGETGSSRAKPESSALVETPSAVQDGN